jgi:hypothetical protein
LGLVLRVLAVLGRAGAFEGVDHVDDDFDGWDESEERKISG